MSKKPACLVLAVLGLGLAAATESRASMGTLT